MLSNAPVSAILPSTNLERSQDFYENKLGLKSVEMPGIVMFEAGEGTMLGVYHRPEGNQAEHTQAGFNVDNLEEVMRELEGKGVKFEDYPDLEGFDIPTHTLSYGPAKSAWFKDPDGNILAVNQM